ncbi:MAG: phytanoyl-CoA dioxygenase family protein [Methylacidiphilales bacterium]|nr:phytanoyl-CoA dioxygenase family protein [Candidatus Methylacidiphilales bacterium]
MKTTITQDQIAQYQRDGFVPIPGFLSPAEVAELKAAVLETGRTMGKNKVAGNAVDWVEKEEFYDKVFTQRLNLWKLNDTIKRYVLNPELGKMMCALEGIEGIRMFHDQSLIKEPFANATAWHLDVPYFSFLSPHCISVWIALEDATYQNGCMYFLPGTHKVATFENVGIGQNQADLFKVQPKLAQGADPVGVPMKAGDCSFHNGLTAHGAGANMTRGRRIAMTCAYMPEGSTFNGQRNVLPKAYFDSLKVGDVMESEEELPLVYSSRKLAAV